MRNKSRVVLATIAFIGVVGGTFAFKAMRTGIPFVTITNSYLTFGTLYSRVAPFVGTHPSAWITPQGLINTVAISTTGIAVGGPITLTQVGGTATITIPLWTGVTYNTRVVLMN
ncbi:hypothetical protein CLV42_101870 [Chitinophaga ginsengisoli]|uniref:Uncharacterized protein n=1 Tax=Chitinophaga ginsengisoli TaxID=363837 RepID=A0A2P8GQ62_9BACT|nr:hypothetical protein CLV42_101870 [Chitinophaga ginsengisoli]